MNGNNTTTFPSPSWTHGLSEKAWISLKSVWDTVSRKNQMNSTEILELEVQDELGNLNTSLLLIHPKPKQVTPMNTIAPVTYTIINYVDYEIQRILNEARTTGQGYPPYSPPGKDATVVNGSNIEIDKPSPNGNTRNDDSIMDEVSSEPHTTSNGEFDDIEQSRGSNSLEIQSQNYEYGEHFNHTDHTFRDASNHVSPLGELPITKMSVRYDDLHSLRPSRSTGLRSSKKKLSPHHSEQFTRFETSTKGGSRLSEYFVESVSPEIRPTTYPDTPVTVATRIVTPLAPKVIQMDSMNVSLTSPPLNDLRTQLVSSLECTPHVHPSPIQTQAQMENIAPTSNHVNDPKIIFHPEAFIIIPPTQDQDKMDVVSPPPTIAMVSRKPVIDQSSPFQFPNITPLNFEGMVKKLDNVEPVPHTDESIKSPKRKELDDMESTPTKKIKDATRVVAEKIKETTPVVDTKIIKEVPVIDAKIRYLIQTGKRIVDCIANRIAPLSNVSLANPTIRTAALIREIKAVNGKVLDMKLIGECKAFAKSGDAMQFSIDAAMGEWWLHDYHAGLKFGLKWDKPRYRKFVKDHGLTPVVKYSNMTNCALSSHFFLKYGTEFYLKAQDEIEREADFDSSTLTLYNGYGIKTVEELCIDEVKMDKLMTAAMTLYKERQKK